MLDANLKPWLLEVNHLPSFNSDTASDEKIKNDLIKSTLELIDFSIEHRKRVYFEMKQ